MKFRPLAIYMFGFAIAIGALSYAFFQHWGPNRQETQYYVEYHDQLASVTAQKKKAIDRVLTAKKMVEDSMAKWSATAATRTPPRDLRAGGIDVGVNSWQLPVDARTYRNSIQTLINSRLKIGGVKLPNGGPFINQMGDLQKDVLASLNYPAYAFPVAIYDLNNITVQGTYEQIMTNYRAWGSVPNYIAMPDGLQFAGTTPVLTATYNVIMVGFIRTKDIYPPAPDVIAAAAAGGPGGGGGGGGARGGGRGGAQ